MSDSSSQSHSQIIKAIQGVSTPPDTRIVLIEYQKSYSPTKVFKDREINQKSNSDGSANVTRKRKLTTQEEWKGYIANTIYRISTVGSGFKHARLCVLEPVDSTRSRFAGKVWDYGDGDGTEKSGMLYETGGEWQYDSTSSFQYEGWTLWDDGFIHKQASGLANKTYDLVLNNCEGFCEDLASIVRHHRSVQGELAERRKIKMPESQLKWYYVYETYRGKLQDGLSRRPQWDKTSALAGALLMIIGFVVFIVTLPEYSPLLIWTDA